MKQGDMAKHWRPVNVCVIFYFFIAYAIYLPAYFLPTPQWGRDVMAWITPILKTLDVARRVGWLTGTDPFPAQIIILFCAFNSAFLVFWFAYWIWWRPVLRLEILGKYKKGLDTKDRSRLRLFFLGLVAVLMWVLTLHLLWVSVSVVSPRAIAFYNSGLSSVTFLLITTVFSSYAVLMAPFFFYMAFSKIFKF